MSVKKKNVHVQLRYDKTKTKKKKRVKADNRLSEIDFIQWIFFTSIYHYCCFGNKQVILAFIIFFIVYRTVSYIFERLFKPSGTGPNVLKS